MTKCPNHFVQDCRSVHEVPKMKSLVIKHTHVEDQLLEEAIPQFLKDIQLYYLLQIFETMHLFKIPFE